MRLLNTIRQFSLLVLACVALLITTVPGIPPTFASPGSTIIPLPLPLPPRELLMPLPYRIFAGPTEFVMSVAFSPDSQKLLVSNMEGKVILWDIPSGTEIRRFVGHTGDVHRAVFSSDGKYIVTASVWFEGPPDTTIRLWDAQTGRELTQIRRNESKFDDHRIWSNTVALSNDGKYILTGGDYGGDYPPKRGPEVELWDIQKA